MSFESRVMNLPHVLSVGPGASRIHASKMGHRAARHSAAEIATEADALVETLAKALQDCADRLEVVMKHSEDLIAHMQAHRALAAYRQHKESK